MNGSSQEAAVVEDGTGPMARKQPGPKKHSSKCMLEQGLSARDLDGFARKMDEVEIPTEMEAECGCSNDQSMA